MLTVLDEGLRDADDLLLSADPGFELAIFHDLHPSADGGPSRVVIHRAPTTYPTSSRPP